MSLVRSLSGASQCSRENRAAGRQMDAASAEREAGAVGRTRRARCRYNLGCRGLQPNILWLLPYLSTSCCGVKSLGTHRPTEAAG